MATKNMKDLHIHYNGESITITEQVGNIVKKVEITDLDNIDKAWIENIISMSESILSKHKKFKE